MVIVGGGRRSLPSHDGDFVITHPTRCVVIMFCHHTWHQVCRLVLAWVASPVDSLSCHHTLRHAYTTMSRDLNTMRMACAINAHFTMYVSASVARCPQSLSSLTLLIVPVLIHTAVQASKHHHETVH